jgi:hypothetical protein
MSQDRGNKKPTGKFSPAPKLPLIPPGTYQATIREWNLQRQYDRSKILVQIDVGVDDELIRLTYFVTTKMDEHGQMREPTGTMKLHKMLRNLWPATSFQDIDMDELINMRCRVVVDTVIRDSQRQEKPFDKQYSAIREILPPGEIKPEDSSKDPWDEAGDEDIPF